MAFGLKPRAFYRWTSLWGSPENKDNTVPDYDEFQLLTERVEKLERKLNSEEE